MPNLPTIEVTQSQYDTIMGVWDSEEDFKSWLLTNVIDRVVNTKVSELVGQMETQMESLRNNIYTELSPPA